MQICKASTVKKMREKGPKVMINITGLGILNLHSFSRSPDLGLVELIETVKFLAYGVTFQELSDKDVVNLENFV